LSPGGEEIKKGMARHLPKGRRLECVGRLLKPKSEATAKAKWVEVTKAAKHINRGGRTRRGYDESPETIVLIGAGNPQGSVEGA